MKVYSDKKYLSGDCHMLIPFWGINKDISDPDKDRFDIYQSEGKSFLTFTNLEESDVTVYPGIPIGNKFIEFQNYTYPKKVIVFFNSDSDEELLYRENVFVFRTSFYKSKKKKTEFAIPGWSMDYGQQNYRKWSENPVVSFCGQSLNPANVREAGLKVLENDPRIKTIFLRRDSFWAGWMSKRNDSNFALKVRKEFIDNITNSDYVFCARGGGNFSYRIYEVMMNGRIPILLNTDCVLPYDFIIDWNNLFPIIDIKNIDKLPEVLLNFHNSIKESFEERQNLIRKVWKDYISPTGFFKNIEKHF